MNESERVRGTLEQLAETVIATLRSMPQPIVRVCGPLTTGGFGYAENARRLAAAEQILKQKGYTVFEFGPAESSIQAQGFPHAAIMEFFHKRVLDSALISEAFFLAGWDRSKGARIERDICESNGTIRVTDFPEAWFAEAGYAPLPS